MRTWDPTRMGKQVTATIVVLLFCLLYTVAIVAQERNQRSLASDAASAKAEVNKLGFGKRVNVKLNDGKKANGRITGFAQDHFVVTNSKGAASAIAYTEVFRVERQKEKLGIFDKPWQGIMFTAAAVGAVFEIAMGIFN
ncbi:MAG TPA: hypothetical protein VJV21_01230 [Pyrinomonadaceae bacterium]|nr:hypothetical protein [Pyrinomonadaceae bacterium]